MRGEDKSLAEIFVTANEANESSCYLPEKTIIKVLRAAFHGHKRSKRLDEILFCQEKYTVHHGRSDTSLIEPILEQITRVSKEQTLMKYIEHRLRLDAARTPTPSLTRNELFELVPEAYEEIAGWFSVAMTLTEAKLLFQK
jgi:hypothetical protein